MAGGKKGGPNAKQVAGRAKKAENEAQKQAELDRQAQAKEAAEWKKGANVRRAARDDAAQQKADEMARKKQEKAELLAAEEAELGKGGKAKGPNRIRTKSKKKDDLSLLEDTLVKGADKKVKKKKEEEALKKKKQEEAEKKKEQKEDPLLANTANMIGTTEQVGREANVARMEEGASGIDAALQSLNVSVGGEEVKSFKALYKAFEDRMLPQVRSDYPGLRLSQLKEKVWALWKKSPENPENRPQA